MTHAQDFIEFIHSHPEEKSGDSATMSGSSRVHYGLSNPTMRGFVKNWAKIHKNVTYDAWHKLLDTLYGGQSIEENALAGFLLGHYATYRQQLPLSDLDAWIGRLEGWREIDTTCQSNYTANEVLATWDNWDILLRDLATRPTIQHRRASLVLLVKPVRDNADSRLIEIALHNVELLKYEQDKLITKAISWILRESIKRHRHIVGEYVASNIDTLPPIVVREFNKKFTTGKK